MDFSARDEGMEAAGGDGDWDGALTPDGRVNAGTGDGGEVTGVLRASLTRLRLLLLESFRE